ncbi:MAG TPA: alpha/beta hydrolase, partial [Caldilineaceae bacterium]|nr:alpha/beta hydrolase [Caldilineaceae bacterium]
SFGSSRWWEPLLALLPEAIYAMAPDLRGCGATEKAETGYTVEEQAADVAALVESLGWQNFDLVGHAAGGAIAFEFALQQPNLLNTLTLIAPAPIEGIFTPIDGIMALAEMQHNEALLRQGLSLLLSTYDQSTPAAQPFFEALVADAQGMATNAFTGMAESLNRWNRFREAQQVTLPTLLIWGDRDPIIHRDAMTRSLIAIPGAANLDVLRNVGHSPMVEAPLALAEHLLEFITEDYDAYAEAREVAAGDFNNALQEARERAE